VRNTTRTGRVPALAALVAAALSGCHFFAAEASLELSLPGPPPGWPAGVEVSSYRILWRGAEGELREAEADGDADDLSLRIPRREGLSVLVYPRFAGGRFETRPAAAVYPHHAGGDGVLEPRYEHGFTGLVLHAALFSRPAFNTARLLEEVTLRAAGNPWAFDLERVIEKLAAGSFSTIYLRPRDHYPVEIPVAPGAYLPDNPLREPVTATGPDPSILIELTPGLHRFMREDEEMVVTVSVGEDGTVRVFER
jgi:hypothetical protein